MSLEVVPPEYPYPTSRSITSAAASCQLSLPWFSSVIARARAIASSLASLWPSHPSGEASWT